MSATGKITAFTPTTGRCHPIAAGGRRWLAVLGSVGQPRDGNPAASYAMLDTEQRELTYCRAPYDVGGGRCQNSQKWLTDLGSPTGCWWAVKAWSNRLSSLVRRSTASGSRNASISGGMATLWRVSRPGTTMPMLMKVPKIAEGEDPAAIVSFEMEQMILPRLSGVHVPKFVAAGDFAVQPYIVMERIPGTDAIPAAPPAPIALCGRCRHRLEDRRGIGRPASAACDSPRRQTKQHHVSADRRGRARSISDLSHHDAASRSDAGGVSRAFRHRSLHVARAIARHPQRSEKRSVCSGRAAIFLFYGCASVRRKRDDVRHAPAAVARSGSSAPIEAGLSAVAARDRLALPRDRTGMALSDRGATCLRVEPSRPSQADQRDPSDWNAIRWTTVLRRRFNKDLTRSITLPALARADLFRPDCRGRRRSGGRIGAAQRCAPHRRGTHSDDTAFRATCLPQRASSSAGLPLISRWTNRATTSGSIVWSR